MKNMSTAKRLLSEVIAIGWMFIAIHANAQTAEMPRNYNQILSNAGIAKSQFLAGKLGVPSQAERWYQLAAEQGHGDAADALAILSYCGDERPLDMKRALVLLQERSELGSASAPWLIGISYFFGDSVTQDYAQSIPWLELSARRGNPYAVQLLIKIYREGLGTPKSEEKLVWWLRFATDRGDKRSLIQYAEYLANAPEGKRNLIASYFWLLSAQKVGVDIDQKLVKEIETGIDGQVAKVIRQGIAASGKFVWSEWNYESLGGGYIFPCMRHLENPVLKGLSSPLL